MGDLRSPMVELLALCSDCVCCFWLHAACFGVLLVLLRCLLGCGLRLLFGCFRYLLLVVCLWHCVDVCFWLLRVFLWLLFCCCSVLQGFLCW